MKRSLIVLALLINTVPLTAITCPKNCAPYDHDICACDAPTEKATAVKPDDAKPPRNSRPEWETGEVKTVNEPSASADDAKQDAEIKAADDEGKKAAGIKL